MSDIVVERLAVALGAERIIDDLSFTVASGELCCLLGPSGCGKTTLLRVVGGLVPATSGRVTVGGRPPADAWREVAYVFQAPRLVPWRDALGNVRLGVELRDGTLPRATVARRARAALELVGLVDGAAKYPAVLSGGERQRVALARALAVDPAVILMDEPFSALDAETRERLRESLREIWRAARKTILFVTHDRQEAAVLGEHLVVLSARPARVLEERLRT